MKRILPALLLLPLATVSTAQTAPSTAPAPSAAPDFSTPKAALKTFLSANDESTLRAAVAAAPDAVPFLDVMAATIRLQHAAEKQFGASSAQYFSKGTDAALAARLKQVDKAEETLNGNTATLTLPADEATRAKETTITLQKSAGGWKLDAASLFSLSGLSKEDLARHAQSARNITTITNQTIADIEARKFTSASDAYTAYWTKTAAPIKKLDTAATKPAK